MLPELYPSLLEGYKKINLYNRNDMMTTVSKRTTFKYVDYLWNDADAAKLGDDQVALFLYRSNLLGTDLRITNYGGGNTSCKTIEKDPLTGKEVEVMWVKGSGGDIGTLTRQGIAGLYTERLRNLKNVYRGIEFEDEIVPLYYHCLCMIWIVELLQLIQPLHGLITLSSTLTTYIPMHLFPLLLQKIVKSDYQRKFGEIQWVGCLGNDLGLT